MVRPKDAKVWNEELINALEARYQKSIREGKRDTHSWRVGAITIQAVRKDIYQFRTGTIVNMPTNLTKRVHRLCEDIIRGIKNVYPDGHVPTNNNNNTNNNIHNNYNSNYHMHQPSSVHGGGGMPSSASPSSIIMGGMMTAASPASVPSNSNSNSNPFINDHYMNNLKIRGGAFAILMAFYHSQSDVLRKSQICREAQRFCDDEMESNFHGGRMYGAWSSMKTLQSHQLVTGGGTNPTFGTRGFRSQPAEYTLTRNGKLFIDALFSKRPEAATAGQVISGTSFAAAASPAAASPFFGDQNVNHTASHYHASSPLTTRVVSRKGSNMYTDKTDLDEWIKFATIGDQKKFKVGKDRRKKLHDLCDSLQRQHPGLVLTHNSTDSGRQRVLTIQIHSMPLSSSSSSSSSRVGMNGKKSLLPYASPADAIIHSGYDHQYTAGQPMTTMPPQSLRTPLSARENAARAAMKRQKVAKEENELKDAIAESKKAASLPPRPSTSRLNRRIFSDRETIDIKDSSDEDEEDHQIQKAINLSLKEPDKLSLDDNIDDELLQSAIAESNKLLVKSQTIAISEQVVIDIEDNVETKKCSPLKSEDIIQIDSDDSESRIASFSPSYHRKRKRNDTNTQQKKKKERKELLKSVTDQDDVIEITENEEEIIDLVQSQNESISIGYHDIEDSFDDTIVVDDQPPNGIAAAIDSTLNVYLASDTLLTTIIDNRERNRNATPRTLRMELKRHLASGSLRAVWPHTLPLSQVEEARLQWGDIQYSVSNNHENRRLGVSIERKRVNDLVQRSFDGDHFTQLFRMRQRCSLSVLLIENDTRRASDIIPFNAQNREGFDPFDSTITCENDVFNMFGRILVSCDKIKFLQTQDEQSSLRAIGALGLMAVSAPTKYTNEIDQLLSHESNTSISNADDFQALCDQLKQGGISWRLAKRVANASGGLLQLKALYNSCCDEYAKLNLLSHVIESGNNEHHDDLRNSASRWSEAIYRIISYSRSSNKVNGEAALLLHKNVLKDLDHGLYLSTLYQDYSHDEVLNHMLKKQDSVSNSSTVSARYVSIRLTNSQAQKCFPQSADKSSFYKLSIASGSESEGEYLPITMRTVKGQLSSKLLTIYEVEGSKIVDLIRSTWSANKKDDYVVFAKLLASRVDTKYRSQHRMGTQRVILICGLQPALDADAKKSGYMAETKTIVDLLFSELLLCYNITILQALRKKLENRVDIIRQLALACFHYGFLVEKKTKE